MSDKKGPVTVDDLVAFVEALGPDSYLEIHHLWPEDGELGFHYDFYEKNPYVHISIPKVWTVYFCRKPKFPFVWFGFGGHWFIQLVKGSPDGFGDTPGQAIEFYKCSQQGSCEVCPKFGPCYEEEGVQGENP